MKCIHKGEGFGRNRLEYISHSPSPGILLKECSVLYKDPY